VRPLLVIGYGNPLRGDDAFGSLAAENLAARGIPGLEVLVCRQLNPELALDISQARHVIFLDAALSDQSGDIAVKRLKPAQLAPAPSSHHFEPETLLALSELVYGKVPEATLITASAHSFELNSPVSDNIRNAASCVGNAIASLAASELTHDLLVNALAG
jgi:hydrogenase maturation protease